MIASKPRLLSIANAVAYGINALVTFGLGPFASPSDKSNAALSEKYQTLITPNAVAFSIWALIFFTQAIFVISTLISMRQRTHPLVVDGVSFDYIIACLAQAAWSPSFASEKMILSSAFMGCILLGLTMIVVSQYKVVSKIKERETTTNSLTWKTFWLLQFPFELHLGWIIAAFALNLNVLVVALGGSADAQLVVAAASLVTLGITSVACLFALERPRYMVTLVAAWATFWMSFELRDPKPLIKDTFSADQIKAFVIATGLLSGVLIVLTAVKCIHRYYVVSKTNTSSGELSGEKENLISEDYALEENRCFQSILEVEEQVHVHECIAMIVERIID